MTAQPTAQTTAQTNPIGSMNVIPSTEGAPVIRWDMTIEAADQILTWLGGTPKNHPHAALAQQIIDPLYLAVSEAVDFTATKATGCMDLWPDAAPMNLTEPAVLGNDTGDMLTVLIPGTPSPLEATTLAVQVAREGGADLDPSDETLMSDVHPARWMVLNTCESSTHDFHPELAMLGARTPGAVLVTRVVLSHA